MAHIIRTTMSSTHFLLFLLLFLAQKGKSSESSDSSNPQVQDLFEEYFDWKMRKYPIFASNKGYHAYDGLLPNRSLAAATLDVERPGSGGQEGPCKAFRRKGQDMLAKADSLQLSPREIRYLKLLAKEADVCVKGSQFQGYLFPEVNFLEGVQSVFSSNFKKEAFFKTETLDDYKVIIKRLSGIPRYLDGIIEILNEGIRQKITYAVESLSRVRKQFAGLRVANVEDSVFFYPFTTFPKQMSPDDRAKITNEAKKVISEEVLPAFQKLDDYIHGVYFPKTRRSPGVSALTNGRAFYQACLEFHTGLSEVTPDEVHRTGLEGVAELKKGVEELARRRGQGRSGEDFNLVDFLRQVKEDPAQQFQTREEVLEHFKTFYKKKVNPKLKDYFLEKDLTPNVYKLDVKPFPPGWSGLAYYFSGTADGSRKGAFYVNLFNLSSLRRFETAALALHEGNPGHHLQYSFNFRYGFPKFVNAIVYDKLSTVPSRTPINTAHIEGWGLYTEYLGNEMGIYEEDDDYLLGFYAWNLLRSARLVVDTGLHVLGWSRQQAIDYLGNNTALSEDFIGAEIDRYITWPGQATAYKMGEIKVRALRQKMEQEMGEKFDLKSFHHYYLSCMGPMDGLEECMRMQMEDEGSGATRPKPAAFIYSVISVMAARLIFSL